MSIVYDYFGGLYINLTNKCPNACEFCIRNYTNALGDADSLVLAEDPSVDEVKDELARWDVANYDEVVFCGYGEPMERLPELLKLAKHIKAKYGKPIRINTNGLADLIWEGRGQELSEVVQNLKTNAQELGMTMQNPTTTAKNPVALELNPVTPALKSVETAPLLEGLIDAVSVSMNEADAQKYYDLCHPRFGLRSYDAIIKYIKDVQKYVPYVATSVVSSAISRKSIEICRAKAAELGVAFKVR